MDDGGQIGNGRQKQWNLNKLLHERDAAIKERDRAIFEKNLALDERELAIRQRNLAIKERKDAIVERDRALSALQSAMISSSGFNVQDGPKRIQQPGNQSYGADAVYGMTEAQLIEALRRTMVEPEVHTARQPKQSKDSKPLDCDTSKPQKGKGLGEDLNMTASSVGVKRKKDWDVRGLGLNHVNFDETVMPIPGCSCTGTFRQCYKWGSGGWQSSCCTTTMSVHPLPRMATRRYARIGGRKMSGSVFTRLLNQLASEGYDFSVPVDLKKHWSKHGTNRYITIK